MRSVPQREIGGARGEAIFSAKNVFNRAGKSAEKTGIFFKPDEKLFQKFFRKFFWK